MAGTKPGHGDIGTRRLRVSIATAARYGKAPSTQSKPSLDGKDFHYLLGKCSAGGLVSRANLDNAQQGLPSVTTLP